MFCALFGFTLVNAQDERPTGVFTKVDVAPVIDGVGDDAAWADAPKYNIDKPFQSEVPTIGGSGDSYFQTVWTTEGISVLVTVKDDEWFPGYESGVADWQSDKIEVYFDVNAVLLDGKGGSGGKPTGHYQFAPAPLLELIDGTPTTETDGWSWAYNVDGDAAYVFELWVPLEWLTDSEGALLLTSATVGFDVTVVDRETVSATRNRAVWANVGLQSESWSNMDDCGWMTFEGAGETILVTSVEVTSASDVIDTEAGTLQIVANVLPANATYNTVIWKVENVTGKASINDEGLLTAELNGTVIVTGTAKDGTGFSDSKEITISNQVVTMDDINAIKDGTFTFDDGPLPLGAWATWSGNGGTAEVIDGVCVMTPGAASDQWQLQVNQNNWIAYNDTTYKLTFEAWADADRVFGIDFEDNANGYNRFGDSPDDDAVDGASEWQVALTTVPTVYERTVTFMRIKDNTNYLLNIMPSAAIDVVYIDNISLISLGGASLLTPPATSITLQAFVPGTETMVTSISTDDGQLQVSATVLPSNAAQVPVYSIVKGSGDARIDASGLLTAVANGTVTVVGTDWIDPTVKDELEITITGQVGVKEDLANQFNIYPNPVTNELNVEMTSVNSKVVIFNSLGSKIHEVMVNGLTTTIDVSNMARGVYYIQVNDSAAQKFVK